MKFRTIADILLDRKMTALLLLGFASGLPAQALEGPLQLWLKSQSVSAAEITAISGAASLPYAWKFLWSPAIDRYVPPGLKNIGRRQSWLLLTQCVLVVLLVLMALQNPQPGNLAALTVIAVLIGFVSASQDIASDAYRTDVLDKRESGTGAALWTNGFRIAVLIAGNLIVGLADEKRVGHWSWQQIYLLMAGLLVVGMFASLWAPTPPADVTTEQPKSLKDAVVKPVRDFLERKGVGGGATILLFILTYKLGDYMVKAVSKLFLKDLGFSATDIASTGAVGIIAAIFGALAGGMMMLRVGMNRSLWLASVGLSIGILPYVLLAQHSQPDLSWLTLVVVCESVAAGLEAAVFVAFMMSLCNKRFSATQFALFSSFMLAGKSLIVTPMGGFYQSLGGRGFFWLSVLAAIPSLLLLLYVAPLNVKQSMKTGKSRTSSQPYAAITAFSHAIDLQPKNAEAYWHRGLVRAILGSESFDRNQVLSGSLQIDRLQAAMLHYSNAIADLKQSLHLQHDSNPIPASALTIDDLTPDPAVQAELRSIANSALTVYEKAIATTPTQKRATLYWEKALILTDLDYLHQATIELCRAIDLDPEDARYVEHQGKVFYREGNYEDALANFQTAIELAPKDGEHYINCAWVQDRLGRSGEAMQNANIAQKLLPRDNRELKKLFQALQGE
jgi:MFS transporter, PAT family, beta-lactamase induction signal transducer AmpG